jgi:hypothetical protein
MAPRTKFLTLPSLSNRLGLALDHGARGSIRLGLLGGVGGVHLRVVDLKHAAKDASPRLL